MYIVLLRIFPKVQRINLLKLTDDNIPNRK